jgi:hypothetical protein
MGLFGKMFEPKVSVARLMLEACLKGSNIMLEENQISKGAVFEVLLFSSLHILREYKQKRPNLYGQFEEDYFGEVYRFARKEGILNNLPCRFPEFINDRMRLYDQQLKSMDNNPEGKFMPTKIVYNFYERPLTNNGGDSYDLEASILTIVQIKYLFKYLDECFNLMT